MRSGARQKQESIPHIDRPAAHLRDQLTIPSVPTKVPHGILCRYFAWPFLVISSASILALGFASEHETIYFDLSYAWIVAWLLLLERTHPYRPQWRLPDGQIKADLAHTLLSKGLVQAFIVALIGSDLLDQRPPTALTSWPLPAQVIFGLVASELGLYAIHRLEHEWPLLWRFHAVHHSVRKLWLVNTGRFHVVDSFDSVLASLPFLLLSGISMDAIVWVSAFTAYIGILTHCNVDMHCGWLSLVFNTPNLHRWHHAADATIGNNNYGENLVLWDQLFGTYYRRDADVTMIGISQRMPADFWGQLVVPFRWKRYQGENTPAL
jgi:ornithine lipid hydroxylase